MTLAVTDREELKESLERHISCQTWGQIRGLQVAVDGTGIHIRGRAGSYYMKQRAIQGVLEVLGSERPAPLDLNIQIEPGEPGTSRGGRWFVR